MRGICIVVATSLGTTSVVAQASAPVAAQASAQAAEPVDDSGSLITTEALGCGKVGMEMGLGVAVLLPFYALEIGVGLSETVDFTARFETVMGVLHFPDVGLRWMVFEVGGWRFGTRLQQHYSFFGIQTDQLNLTSTFYTLGEIGFSGPITDESELVFAVQGEFDWFEHRVVDDESQVVATYRYDATTPRFALQTKINDDLDGYLQLRLRIPTETFQYEAQTLYVIPLLGLGATWTF
jgi:hypothetical protein